MDKAEIERLVDLLKPPLNHASEVPLPSRNVQLFMAMDAGEKDGADTFPSTQELLSRWIEESARDKNAWDTLNVLTATLLHRGTSLPAELGDWARDQPPRPRTGENDANRNRAIRAAIELLTSEPVGLPKYGNDESKRVSASDIVAGALGKSRSAVKSQARKR